MQVQQDQLTALTQKEQDLRTVEKRNQDALHDIEQQRLAFETIQKKESQENQATRDAIAREQTMVRAEREQVDAEKRSVQAAEAKCRQLEYELVRRRVDLMRIQSAIQANRRVESEKHASDRRAVEAKLQAAQAARAKQRDLALQSLAALTVELFGSGLDREPVRRVAGPVSAGQGR